MRRVVVHTPNIFLFKAITEHCEQVRGHKVGCGSKEDYFNCNKSETCVSVNGGSWGFAARDYFEDPDVEFISIEEYFKRYDPPAQKKIMIGDYEVGDFSPEGFNVGCTFVSWETAEEIMSHQPEE